MSAGQSTRPVEPAPRAPAWFVVSTAVLAAILLLMAVTETSLLGHYLIDQGEFVAVIGLGFVAIAAVVLYRGGRLRASLPFVLPWLLYPVVTQGDQVIDNLSIGWMRLLTHLLLALIFAAPVLVLAFGARALATTTGGRAAFASPALAWIPGLRLMAEGRLREGVAMLAALLFSVEFLAAHMTLGLLMIALLIVMTGITLSWGARPEAPVSHARPLGSERRALVFVLVGVVVSGGLYLGYKNRPGAYQGSPSYLLDPSQQAAGYALEAVVVPTGEAAPLDAATVTAVRAELALHAKALDRLVDGYYIAERNYTFDFHNELFLRRWPVLTDYRRVALGVIAEAREIAHQANAVAVTLPASHPVGAWMAEVRAFVRFNFDRAAVLERLTGEFEQTKAGLQHAAHIYEGEGKLVGLGLAAIDDKHRRLLEAPSAAPVLAEFVAASRAIYGRYADRIVGF
jgi:hypothetical protein